MKSTVGELLRNNRAVPDLNVYFVACRGLPRGQLTVGAVGLVVQSLLCDRYSRFSGLSEREATTARLRNGTRLGRRLERDEDEEITASFPISSAARLCLSAQCISAAIIRAIALLSRRFLSCNQSRGSTQQRSYLRRRWTPRIPEGVRITWLGSFGLRFRSRRNGSGGMASISLKGVLASVLGELCRVSRRLAVFP